MTGPTDWRRADRVRALHALENKCTDFLYTDLRDDADLVGVVAAWDEAHAAIVRLDTLLADCPERLSA